MALTKADLANRLFEEVGLNKREAKEFVDAYFEIIRVALESGENVKLSGFGNFQLRDKNERPGRNPKTGAGLQDFAKYEALPHEIEDKTTGETILVRPENLRILFQPVSEP